MCSASLASVLDFSAPAVPMGPERAAWTLLPLGIVDAFFMWAANDPVGNDNTLCSLFADEEHDFFIHFMIASDVSAVAEPTFHRNRVLIVTGDDPHSDFGGELVVRPVVRDGSDWITGEAAVRFLSQRFGMSFA